MNTKAKECYMNFVNEVCEILGLGKPADILRLCAIISEFEEEIREQALAEGRDYKRRNR